MQEASTNGWYGRCKGCGAPAFLRPAPGGVAEERGDLYCGECHRAGKAVYEQPPAAALPGAILLKKEG